MAVDNPIHLDGFPVDVQPEYAQTVLAEAFKGSVVGNVVSSEPLTLGGQVQPVYDGGVEVGLVSEGGTKPQSGVNAHVETLTTSKVATIVVVSKEAAMANPGRMLEHVEQDMRNAISRAVDSLVLHNRDPRGDAYTGTNKAVVGANTNEIFLGDYTSEDPLGDALLEAYDLAGETGDPNAWLFDPRLRARLTRRVQDVERGLPDLSGAATNVAGLPAYYNKIVSGRTSQATDNGIRGILGDFSKVRYGFVERLDIQRSTQATVGGVSMFETNQVALLVEAILGWTVTDQSAFTVIRDGASAGDGDDDGTEA